MLSADDLPEKPDAALVQFIEAGKEPPLYIGWGSMAHESGQYMTELAVRALHMTWLTRIPNPLDTSIALRQVRALHAIGKRGIVFEG